MEREKKERGERRQYTDSERAFMAKKRAARFAILADAKIDYKNLALLEKFMTDSGKIISRRITSVNGKQSRQIEESIKRARYLGLLGPHTRA